MLTTKFQDEQLSKELLKNEVNLASLFDKLGKHGYTVSEAAKALSATYACTVAYDPSYGNSIVGNLRINKRVFLLGAIEPVV